MSRAAFDRWFGAYNARRTAAGLDPETEQLRLAYTGSALEMSGLAGHVTVIEAAAILLWDAEVQARRADALRAEAGDVQSETDAAIARIKNASIIVADILDADERDPTWHETQELENAALALGRALRKSKG